MARTKTPVTPTVASISDAVGRFINLNHDPDDVSVEEILTALCSEAEDALEVSSTGHEAESERIRLKVCEARLELANLMRQHLECEIDAIKSGANKNSSLKLSSTSSAKDLMTTDSLQDWVDEQYWMRVDDWAPINKERRKAVTDEEREKLQLTIGVFAKKVVLLHDALRDLNKDHPLIDKSRPLATVTGKVKETPLSQFIEAKEHESLTYRSLLPIIKSALHLMGEELPENK